MDVQFLDLVEIFIIFQIGYLVSGNTNEENKIKPDKKNKIIPESAIFNKDIYFQEFYTFIDNTNDGNVHKFDTMGLTKSTPLTNKDWFFRITMGAHESDSQKNKTYDLIVLPDKNVAASSVLLEKYYYTAVKIPSCYVYTASSNKWKKVTFDTSDNKVKYWKITSSLLIDQIIAE